MTDLAFHSGGGGAKGLSATENETPTLLSGDTVSVVRAEHYRKAKRASSVEDDETWVQDNETWVQDDETNTLTGFDSGDTRAVELAVSHSVRRLTPTECERLMGWPDGWTCLCEADPYSTHACSCPDGPRYAACGNGVVAPVAEWIGRRMVL